VLWLVPESELEVMWDHSMGADASQGQEVRELMSKAFKGPLQALQQQQLLALLDSDPKALEQQQLLALLDSDPKALQQQQLLALIDSDPKVVYQFGLTPRRLADLVDNNLTKP
ncbi:hypothetical protein T484DRAFT_1797813, partial [Baffinella frigidus]